MKKKILCISIALIAMTSFSQESPLVQYTPDQAEWSTFYTKPDAVSSITSHDPDGIGWISSWPTWDGTVYNPSEMTRSEFTEAICPSGDVIRGIREVFYENNPFADNENPTKAEVDEWHRISINHVRAMVGYTSEDRQVEKDHCMYARALWGQERRFTTKWDADYPENTCAGSDDPHCGASFIPSLEDQAPYLPEGHPGCSTSAGAEGVSNAPKSNIPWSIKWSRAFCQYLGSEGFWGGHVGPFFHRQKFGFSFWDRGINDQNSNATLRAKWTGTLMPNVYEDPSLSVTDIDRAKTNSKLYPNPVIDNLYIELAPAFDANTTQATIVNIIGQQVSTFSYQNSVDMSNYKPGVYMLQLKDGKNVQTIKFIKQ